ncbi:helix-turn-helix transcriptional regulator [Legionella worsleiensis]|uniref:Helix-turn-helix protein n=1 Tax=Legionella worsleiensis TaxID=45076 RepID=A0A0W1A377_9GAMM|nr:helix-turn-helix transcriptional regulator [Legionella worsleiensis]KTD75770.1 helix-turn-helix protein [Legionella worsleiensis]STY32787.1 Predicted transcriptional regulator [Legionella worsleiensis]
MITKDTQETLKYLENLMGEKLTLGSFILAIRQGEELSQVEFAKMLGVSRQVLCDIEHGRRIISPKKAAEYADLLGYSKKQFVRLCLQDMIDRDHLGLVVEIENAA